MGPRAFWHGTGTNQWISLFAAALTRAVHDAQQYEEHVRGVQSRWREALGPLRSDSTALLLVEALPGAPVVTVQSAAALIGRSIQATNQAIDHLQAAGVLRQTTVGKRNRGFEAAEFVDGLATGPRASRGP